MSAERRANLEIQSECPALDYAPNSFQHAWTKNNERENAPKLRNENEFRLPIPRIEQFKKIPLYALPYEWNQAGELTLYSNRTTFKFALRDQLFSEIPI